MMQKQYDRADDVASILQRMKEVYAIPDRHTRYVPTKEFFRAKMTEGSSVQEHGVKMLSLAEKLEELKVGLDNDMCIDWEWANERGGWVLNNNRWQTISAPITVRKGIGRGIVPIYLAIKVLQRSRKLSKDEVVLRLGDGNAIAAEAVGIIKLVISDRVRLELKDCYFVPSMIKNIISILLLDNAGFEFLIKKKFLLFDERWFFSSAGMKRLVDSESLEIDNLDNLSACESCLKGKMTRKPFVGQIMLANGLLDSNHTNVCRLLYTQARGGFSYFITFTDDHSRYDYVYLMRYKSEAILRIKEFRLEVENQTVSQWTPPRMPQLNCMTERRNRTLLHMIRSMMSFTELPLSFWGYVLETAARVWGTPAYVKRLVVDKLDSRSSLCRFIGYLKETVGYYFYDPSKQKVFVSRNVVFLERGFPTDTRRDELLLEESSEAPQSNAGASSAPTVFIDNVPILRRSARVP
ncbi:UNVERIFIED_CONTAM: hypothetical protein Sangu_2576600 [Sesamum angustifolium]|uniref:Uncharacterized protein n=1 Tax=Sesamum angustifolium TaxID=2727405 RepID=A0AAW2J7Z6_9LAMI